MPGVDTDLYRNVHTYTQRRHTHTDTHTCMHRYARSGLCIHSPVRSHARTHTHALTHTSSHSQTHTHTHMLRPTKRQVCTFAAGRCYPWSPATTTASPDQNTRKVTNSRGSLPVRAALFRHNVLCKSSRADERFQSLAQQRVSWFLFFPATLRCAASTAELVRQIPFTQKVNNYRELVQHQRVCFGFVFGSENAPL